ncbi:helix-turn-helix transcriptional regulator [Oscillospiraceae bacterium 50-58]
MAEVKDCPGFETFGVDVRAGREAQGMTRRVLAEEVGVSNRYLANIELGLIIPSVPVMLQLIRICHLPVERYFNPDLIQENSEVRRRVRHKTQLCPEKYLPIVEATLDGAINLEKAEDA